MKIAVLFGSFNPLTNAHMSIMKKTVEYLGADLGLFVATNGQYLRKKTVKRNDPFYLSEEERGQIIEKACRTEKNLKLWGYELGGAIPSRYKTLCKIQKEYPEATLYEIQGADKIRTLTMSKNAEEYLKNIHFAIFPRDGIDVGKMFAENPVLEQHRDSFIWMPELGAEAQISSTEVRRRFYAGEDCSDIVPASAVEVLNGHLPSDFTISYAERKKTIMNSGRFGVRAACKEVYAENKQLFQEWMAGNPRIDFGDWQEFLDNTKLYKDAYSVDNLGTVYPETVTYCVNADCVDVAHQLIKDGYNPAILNLASAKRPGGGYDEGYAAQEESLCQSSTLSQSLYQYSDTKYKNIRESGVPHRETGYPLDINYGGIYTPNVTFFRNRKANYFTLREQPFRCDVITVAALSFNGRTKFCGVSETVFRSDSGGFTPEGEAIMLNKIRTIFRMGVENGKDALVLGAFGNGAYKLPVEDVVQLFKRVMAESESKNKFRLVTFAILESTKKPNGIDGHFGAYYRSLEVCIRNKSYLTEDSDGIKNWRKI